MHRPQFLIGLLVLLLGLSSILISVYELPHPPAALSGSGVGNATGQALPSTVPVPSNVTVPLTGAPAGAYLFGNFSVLSSSGPGSSVIFYLLDATQWATYNSTFSKSSPYPSDFQQTFESSTGASWTNATDLGSPFALVYLAPSGHAVTIWERAYYSESPTGSNPVLLVPPQEVTLAPHVALPGRALVPFPTLGGSTFALGGTFSVTPSTPGAVVLYLVSPNGSTDCPVSSFLPNDPACAGDFFPAEGWTLQGTPTTSWFLRLHGTVQGWVMVFLSTLTRTTQVSYNETAWKLPSGEALDPATALTSIGGISAFFGFLAASGAFIRTKAPAGGPRNTTAGLPAAQPAPQSDGRKGAPGAPAGRAPVTAAVASPPSAALRPSAPAASEASPMVVEVEEASDEVPSRAQTLWPASAVPRVTCGLCGTGYPMKGGRSSCPVCGSKSVVYAPATGMELR